MRDEEMKTTRHICRTESARACGDHPDQVEQEVFDRRAEEARQKVAEEAVGSPPEALSNPLMDKLSEKASVVAEGAGKKGCLSASEVLGTRPLALDIRKRVAALRVSSRPHPVEGNERIKTVDLDEVVHILDAIPADLRDRLLSDEANEAMYAAQNRMIYPEPEPHGWGKRIMRAALDSIGLGEEDDRG